MILKFTSLSAYALRRSVKNLLLVMSLLIIVISSGCDEDPPPIDTDPHALKLTLNHSWGSSDLALNDWYVTANSDSFQLTKLIYHLNNVYLFNEAGDSMLVADSWHMVNSESKLNPTFDLGVFDESFSAIRFTIGVADSAVNASGMLNTLFTDPMYWGMANGYINFKLEGKSPAVNDEGVILHVGGYLEPYAAYAEVKVDFGTSILENKLGKNNLNLDVDLSEYFVNPDTIDLSTTNLIHTPGDAAVRISKNWPSMFSFTSID